MVNLEMQVTRTPAGLYTIAWRYEFRAPLDIQVGSFPSDNLKVISPSQLAFAQTNTEDGIFEDRSRTTADVIYDPRNNQFIIFPEGTIRDLVGINNIVDAHRGRVRFFGRVSFFRKEKEFIVPKNQRERVYDVADTMLRKGTAVAVGPGEQNVDTSRFGDEGLTRILYSNESMGFRTEDYGRFLKDKKGINVQSFFLDDENYAKYQKGPYVNGLRVDTPSTGFRVRGDQALHLNSGAFGVRFEKTAEISSKK